MLVGVALIGALGLQFAATATASSWPPAESAVAPRRLRMPMPAQIPDYAAVLHTPIFAPDRRAGDDGGSVQGLQLIGVAASGRGAGSAILRVADGTTHVIGRGESLQGLRLIAVGADRAVFAGATGQLRLVLGAPVAAPATSAAGASAPVTP